MTAAQGLGGNEPTDAPARTPDRKSHAGLSKSAACVENQDACSSLVDPGFVSPSVWQRLGDGRMALRREVGVWPSCWTHRPMLLAPTATTVYRRWKGE